MVDVPTVKGMGKLANVTHVLFIGFSAWHLSVHKEMLNMPPQYATLPPMTIPMELYEFSG